LICASTVWGGLARLSYFSINHTDSNLHNMKTILLYFQNLQKISRW
jgi:hypothetical protein